MRGIRAVARVSLIAALAIAGGVAALPNRAAADTPLTCGKPLMDKLLGGNIKYAYAQIVQANMPPGALPPAPDTFTGRAPSTATVPISYCLVVLSYSSTPANDPTPQNITIYVGLPLNSIDKISHEQCPAVFPTVEGCWNGRTEGQGGGGCTGNNFVNSAGAVANGFVGSGTDGGHGNTTYPSNTCHEGVFSLGQLNYQYIQDWVYNGPQQEILWSKKVANLYYGKAPLYNYWNGCSTGGHQGYALAQTLAGELNGILANAPAMYWTRFQTAQMWGQIAMFDIAQEVIAAGKLAAVQNAAINACDLNDGVQDGIIDDPRTCTFNAKANVCNQTGAPAAPNCLTSTEADAVNVMWDGPRNDSGKRIWFPIDRGTDFNFWDGNAPFGLAPVQFGWDLENPAYYVAGAFPPPGYPGYWGNVALSSTVSAPGTVTTYAAVAQTGSNNVADLTDTFGDLDAFKASGAKMITFVGANDALIMPRGVINYYRVMAARYAEGSANSAKADPSDRFRGVQKFFRLFHAPGVSHCGLGILNHANPPPVKPGSLGPWPQGGADFNAVINWVEKGVAPDQVIGSGNTEAPAFIPGSPNTLTRPLCPYPQTAVYTGPSGGSVTDAANWSCGGDLEKNIPVGTPLSGAPGQPVPCYDVLAKYKHEVNGPLDYQGSGLVPAVCPGPAQP